MNWLDTLPMDMIQTSNMARNAYWIVNMGSLLLTKIKIVLIIFLSNYYTDYKEI